MNKSALKNSVRGFTLVEMLVVISIIAVLVLIVVGVSQIVIGKTGKMQTRLNMEVIRQAIEAYGEVEGYYPPDETDFGGNPNPGNWPDRDWEEIGRASCGKECRARRAPEH